MTQARILVVEDDNGLREALVDTLLLGGYECREVDSGERALLALSRQAVPQLRDGAGETISANRSALGAYVIRSFGSGARDVTLLATGTEVALAIEAAAALNADGLNVAVVSMPCWELFEAQSKAYRQEVLGTAPRVAVEAAGKFGWTRYVDSEDDVIGLDDFGASAPAERLYAAFGITKEAIVAKAKALAASN